MYKWNLCETCLCPYCNTYPETIVHLFCMCPVTLTFYLSICKWMESCHIELPRNTVELVLYGVFQKQHHWHIISHVINAYKQ